MLTSHNCMQKSDEWTFPWITTFQPKTVGKSRNFERFKANWFQLKLSILIKLNFKT